MHRKAQYFFLQHDYDRLLQEIADLKQRAKEVGQEVALWTHQTSETWHDNYGYEEGQRQYHIISGRLRELFDIVGQAEIVTPKAEPKRAGVGNTITVQNTKTKKRRAITLGSWLTWNKAHTSYHSPLGQALMGAKVGDTREFSHGTMKETFIVENIR
jgi:transcription elongation GreA/GreB family factor